LKKHSLKLVSGKEHQRE